MKRFLYSFIFAVSVILSGTIVSCSNSAVTDMARQDDGNLKATLSFAFTEAAVRTIKPAALEWNEINRIVFLIDDVQKKVWDSDGETTAKQKMLSDNSIEISAGIYNFGLLLQNTDASLSSEYEYDDITIACAVLENYEIKGGRNVLKFHAEKYSDGFGQYKVELSWAEDSKVEKVLFRLYDIESSLDSDFEDCVFDKTTSSLEKTAALIPCGTYFISFDFYQDEECNVSVFNFLDTIKIESGRKTSYSFDLGSLNNRYSVIYDLNGGSWQGVYTPVTTRLAGASIELPSTKFLFRYNYDFSGWIDDEGTEITVVPKNTKKDITVHAKWTPVSYSIYYILNGFREQIGSYTVEDEFPLMDLSKEGYLFSGWYENKDLTGEPVEKISEGSYGNKSFYATRTPVEYDITYVLNGGQNAAENPSTYNIEKQSKIFPATRVYYEFVGWYDNESFEGSPVTSISTGSIGNKTLYAKWRKIEYTITYYDGRTSLKSEKYTGEDSFDLFVPEKEGYRFLGWGPTNNQYDNEEILTRIEAGTTGNKTLYARFELIEYKVTYHLDGGNNDSGNKTSYNIKTTSRLWNPNKSGFIFAGWYLASDFSGDKFEKFEGHTGDLDLYAKWVSEVKNISIVVTGTPGDIELINEENGESIVFTASEGFADYLWKLDGVKQLSSGNTFEINKADLIPGVYAVMVKASKNGLSYSASAYITVSFEGSQE